ncbi:MAG: hypothetical protein JW731_15035 [Bacteroidales bacterium]|nr:hypothetical protein [Bacteroidales bacterium]
MNTMTEKESLKIIHEMIAASKGNLKDNSFFYLLWGWLVLIASITHYILLRIGWEYAYLPWPVLMTIGGIASVIAGIRLGKKMKVITVIDKAMMYLWWAFVILILIILIMTSMKKIDWTATYPLIISLYGLGTFVSGGILKFKPLLLGGIACWVISIIAFFVAPINVLLLTALSIVISYLIPGYMLKFKEV